jgi:GTP cyclohydrolase II
VPQPSWFGAPGSKHKLVTIDPFGHLVTDAFRPYFEKGYDIRPTIAVTKAHIDFPEVKEAVRLGRLTPDGTILKTDGQTLVTKAAIEPVWYLPGVAERFNCTEMELRQALFKETNMMYPELLTRTDIKLFLPPIGGLTIYIWGDPTTIPDEKVPLCVRVHDECNGSDVFGSDICTCRPYLAHAIEECIAEAQKGGCGLCIYYRKEGRALGEVTKYLVYNMRKRAEGGDQASEYFNCTKHVAGITDTRFQALMPDALHWLGVTHIHKFISMSDMKYDAIINSGITIGDRVAIPEDLIPADAQVEIAAKVVYGYHAGDEFKYKEEDLKDVKGRASSSY